MNRAQDRLRIASIDQNKPSMTKITISIDPAPVTNRVDPDVNKICIYSNIITNDRDQSSSTIAVPIV